jgi:hypothetical protein
MPTIADAGRAVGPLFFAVLRTLKIISLFRTYSGIECLHIAARCSLRCSKRITISPGSTTGLFRPSHSQYSPRDGLPFDIE